MSGERAFRVVLIVGAAGGAALAVAITLLLDVLYADALGGTWRDAIAKDAETFFSVSLDPGGFAVTLLYLAIILVLGLFGAFMGSLFSVLVYRFIELLTREGRPRGEGS